MSSSSRSRNRRKSGSDNSLIESNEANDHNEAQQKTDIWLKQLRWNRQGLIPVIAQDSISNKVLMFAWMNKDALKLTVKKRKAVYWSRSRQKLWHKGEESGHQQFVTDIRADCDKDVILLKIKQIGGIACHTGRESCFFYQLHNKEWIPAEPILKSPKDIYKNDSGSNNKD